MSQFSGRQRAGFLEISASLAIALGAMVCFGSPALAGPGTPEAAIPEQPAAAPAAPAGGRTYQIARRTPPADPYVSDEAVGKAIEKGADYLMSQFQNGRLADYTPDDFSAYTKGPGADALAVYALLQAGLSIDNPKLGIDNAYMKQLVDVMKTLEPTPGKQTRATYQKGIRATALALINRPEDKAALQLDVEWLLSACRHGGYWYILDPGRSIDSWKKKIYLTAAAGGDNSNSQYGLLGVWSAAEVGCEIPDDYWEVVQKHWTDGQGADGQWGYGGAGGVPSNPHLCMTAAGIASMLVCHDYLDGAKFGSQVGREPFSDQVAKGLQWLETGGNCVAPANNGYSLYALERVGLASGFKRFGTHDWYREGATASVRNQQADGSWTGLWGLVPETAYNVLFLARGRHALLMNKLRFDHFWCNRPRDLTNLCKFSNKELENTFNWQVVTLQTSASDWLDAPVLYIASHEPAKMTDADLAKIKDYVEAGGLLFTHQDGDGAGFTNYVEKTMLPKVCPGYEFTKVPDNSDLYNVYEAVKTKPGLEMVTNGARAMWVHAPNDLSGAWQQNAQKSKSEAFRVGLNLAMYGGGKTGFRARIETAESPAPTAPAAGNIIKVARVKYPQLTWDPEPAAWKKFADYLNWETSVGITTQEVDMADLGKVSVADMPLAHLTGTMAFTPSDAQTQALHDYVNAGGVLFLDSCGGVSFSDSMEKMLTKAFPNASRKKLGKTHPIFKATCPGMVEVGDLNLRPSASATLGKRGGSLFGFSAGKGHVIFTTLDVTNGLLGARTWGIMGFDSPTAQKLLRNISFWAAAGAPDQDGLGGKPSGNGAGAVAR